MKRFVNRWGYQSKISTKYTLKINSSKCLEIALPDLHTVCPRSLDPIYIATYYIKWVKTSWTDSPYTHGVDGVGVDRDKVRLIYI